MPLTIIVILLTLVYITSSQAQLYHKIIHETNPNAKCLDGTSPFVYFHQGNHPNKFMIHFEGGGLCVGFSVSETIENCYNRSKTHLGSSTPWPNSTSYYGYLSTDSSNQFSQWTKVVIGYCDGSLHQGHRKQPISYKNTSLFFRGSDNTRSHFQWLIKQFEMDNADQIILTGQSAGGVASYLWANYLHSIMKNKQSLYIVPDSGFLIPYPSFTSPQDLLTIVLQNMYTLSNLDQSSPMNDCTARNPSQPWKCLYLHKSYQQIIPKILLINSEYDSWAITNTLQIKCLKEGSSGYTLKYCSQSQIEHIQSYRNEFMGLVRKVVGVKKNRIWTIACSHHGYAYDDKFYDKQEERVDGKTVKQALLSFLDGQTVNNIDNFSWPQNTGCAY